MKTKKISKKLALNKLTVANLGNDDMKQINGMGDDISITCASVYPPKCPTLHPTHISCEGGGCGQTQLTICLAC